VAQRADHFYPPSLVQSQFDALQDPTDEPGVLVLDGSQSLQDLAQAAANWAGTSAFE
jgi:gluconokinase